MKYSGDFRKPDVDSLDQAETDMLALISERAQLKNGMDILELRCGWGSLTLWMATHYPRSQIVVEKFGVTSKGNHAYSGWGLRNPQRFSMVSALAHLFYGL